MFWRFHGFMAYVFDVVLLDFICFMVFDVCVCFMFCVFFTFWLFIVLFGDFFAIVVFFGVLFFVGDLCPCSYFWSLAF